MPVIDSPEKLLYTLAGAAVVWLGSILVKKINYSTEQRRREVDELSTMRSENRKLKESLHEHRVAMIKSGQWTQDTLPPFLKET